MNGSVSFAEFRVIWQPTALEIDESCKESWISGAFVLYRCDSLVKTILTSTYNSSSNSKTEPHPPMEWQTKQLKSQKPTPECWTSSCWESKEWTNVKPRAGFPFKSQYRTDIGVGSLQLTQVLSAQLRLLWSSPLFFWLYGIIRQYIQSLSKVSDEDGYKHFGKLTIFLDWQRDKLSISIKITIKFLVWTEKFYYCIRCVLIILSTHHLSISNFKEIVFLSAFWFLGEYMWYDEVLVNLSPTRSWGRILQANLCQIYFSFIKRVEALW